MIYKKSCIFLVIIAVIMLFSFSAFGLGLMVSGQTYPHSASSSCNYPFGWYSSSSGGISFGEMRYQFNKGGAFGSDNLYSKIDRVDISGLKVNVYMSLVNEDYETISASPTNLSSGQSKQLNNKLWKGTRSTTTDWRESYSGTRLYFRGN